MKGTIKTTFTDIDRIVEYSKNKGFLKPQELIRKAVAQYMRQHKDTMPESDILKQLKADVEKLKKHISDR